MVISGHSIKLDNNFITSVQGNMQECVNSCCREKVSHKRIEEKKREWHGIEKERKEGMDQGKNVRWDKREKKGDSRREEKKEWMG